MDFLIALGQDVDPSAVTQNRPFVVTSKPAI
jgi:hypothetical protein